MININTLNQLNEMSLGANIYGLESYIIDYKQASLTTNMYDYEYEYLKLNKILKELKPNSLAFTDKTSLKEEDMDSYDKLLIKYNNRVINKVYGTKNESLIEYINSKENKCLDMIAITNVLGISVRCSYINGHLHKINIIGDSYKYTDITDRFKDKLPNYIKDFSKYNLVELRGKVTIFNNYEKLQNTSLNIECSVMHLLRLNISNKCMDIIIDDIFIDTDEIDINTQWEKLEYIRKLGFNVPYHALIRSVESYNLSEAFNSFREYFNNIEHENSIIYKYNGYQIRDNDELSYEQYYSKFLYIYNNCDYKNVFKAKLKSVLTNVSDKLNIVLKVIKTECNDSLFINEIEVQDINILDTYDLKPGIYVYFIINNGRAILTNNKTNKNV